MSGIVDVGSAIIAVLSAFHTGAEVMDNIRKRNSKKRRKTENAAIEKLVYDTLEGAELQIAQKYSAFMQEIGPEFKTGDDTARDGLLHVSVILQSEIVRSLQIAQKHENAILDLTRLQEDAIIRKRETLKILDDLRRRIPRPSRHLGPAQPYLDVLPERPSFESTTPSTTYETYETTNSDFSRTSPVSCQSPTPDFYPTSATVRESSSKSAFGRLFSMRRSISRRISSASTSSRSSMTPSIDWLSPSIQEKDEDVLVYDPSEEVREHIRATNPNFDAMDKFVSRQTSMSTQSDYSEKSSSLEYSSSCTSPSPRILSFNSSPQSPTVPDTPQTDSPSTVISIAVPDSISAFSTHHPNSPISKSLPSPTFNSVTIGRPNKSNNYWGFCKGAWTIKEDAKKGLFVATRPVGLYNSIMSWQCKNCAFDGDVYGSKKPYYFDTRVRTTENGIKYRWMFLAKSHVKRKGLQDGDSFGCVFCVDEGRGTSVFGDVGTLMDHIGSEHRNIREEIAERNRCYLGDSPVGADWDIYIPTN